MELKDIKIVLHEGGQLPIIRKGNCADIYSARLGVLRREHISKYDNKAIPLIASEIQWIKDGSLMVKEGDLVFLDTGISMEMPEGWYCDSYPRSSTFLKYGLYLSNSVGIIDHEYKGTNDIWRGVFIATRKASIHVNSALIQFTPVEDKIHQFKFKVVDNLNNENRGGFGSTDEVDK